LVGFQVVVGNFFQSVGKAKIATLLTLLRQVIVLIPLLYILPDFLELKGIWISMPIADTCSALIVTYFISREWKKID
jgi:Na+-driven multidrug efflux pump